MNKKPTAEEFWNNNSEVICDPATGLSVMYKPEFIEAMEAHANNAVEEYKRKLVSEIQEIMKEEVAGSYEHDLIEQILFLTNSIRTNEEA